VERSCSKKKQKFIPAAIPGFNKTIFDPDAPILPRSPNRFRDQLEIAKEYLDDELLVLFVTTFNGWEEETYIEPTKEEKFQYLNVLRNKVLGKN